MTWCQEFNGPAVIQTPIYGINAEGTPYPAPISYGDIIVISWFDGNFTAMPTPAVDQDAVQIEIADCNGTITSNIIKDAKYRTILAEQSNQFFFFWTLADSFGQCDPPNSGFTVYGRVACPLTESDFCQPTGYGYAYQMTWATPVMVTPSPTPTP